MKIKIALVDDQNLFRQTLGMLISGIETFELVAQAEHGEALLQTLSQLEILPDILLMDMNLPGLEGSELFAVLNEQYPSIKVIVLSVHAQDSLIAKMINAGASAYLIKNCDRDELILAINSTYETGYYMNKQTLVALKEGQRLASKKPTYVNLKVKLTDRELEVLKLICQQYASSEIAEKLFISPRTVDGHRNNLLLKTESKNTAGLVLYAIKHQLVIIH